MGTVYKETYTKPLPAGAEVFTKGGERWARWTDRHGHKRTAKVTTGRDGSPRIVLECSTHTAKYRDGARCVRKVGTGCRTREAAESVLTELRNRAELVRAKVLTPAQDAAADHASLPIQRHFDAYRDHLTAKGVTETHTKTTLARLDRLARDCHFGTLADLSAQPMDKWLVLRTAEGMSAANRNAHRVSLLAFGNWCVDTDRLVFNPFTKVPTADEKADPRRQRRALTEDELRRLLIVAQLRPLADFGRPTVKVAADDDQPKRTCWTREALTFDGLHEAAERGRQALAKRPDYIATLEARGRERSLIYKTLVLTGLRKGELASLTVGAVNLDSEQPYAVLEAADEKNRQGSQMPLRADLVKDLRQWLADRLACLREAANASSGALPAKLPADAKLFDVPTGLLRILNRDLVAAGIPKRDERDRTVDVHAMRTSFGTHLSKGGVPLRTAQAAMRHSTPILTANVYTDPKLLDVAGALDVLPSLPLPGLTDERQALRATGTADASPTDHRRGIPSRACVRTGMKGISPSPNRNENGTEVIRDSLVPTLVPTLGNRCVSVASADQTGTGNEKGSPFVSDVNDKPCALEAIPVKSGRLDTVRTAAGRNCGDRGPCRGADSTVLAKPRTSGQFLPETHVETINLSSRRWRLVSW